MPPEGVEPSFRCLKGRLSTVDLRRRGRAFRFRSRFMRGLLSRKLAAGLAPASTRVQAGSFSLSDASRDEAGGRNRTAVWSLPRTRSATDLRRRNDALAEALLRPSRRTDSGGPRRSLSGSGDLHASAPAPQAGGSLSTLEPGMVCPPSGGMALLRAFGLALRRAATSGFAQRSPMLQGD